MTLHRFEVTQRLPVPLEEAWEFFTDPRNLARITPPEMAFEVTSPLPPHIRPGLMISYRVRPLFGLAVEWVTEITQVVEGALFIDEQRAGPYRLWHHEHAFRQIGDETEVRDTIYYMLPFGRLGDVAHRVVAPRIRHIFEHRRSVLEERFGRRAEFEMPRPAVPVVSVSGGLRAEGAG